MEADKKLCSYCKKPGARLKCVQCKQRRYCGKKCQKKDWKRQHREQCKQLQDEAAGRGVGRPGRGGVISGDGTPAGGADGGGRRGGGGGISGDGARSDLSEVGMVSNDSLDTAVDYLRNTPSHASIVSAVPAASEGGVAGGGGGSDSATAAAAAAAAAEEVGGGGTAEEVGGGGTNTYGTSASVSPPPPTAAAAAATSTTASADSDGGGGGGGAAAAEGTSREGGVDSDASREPENPCPICLDEEDTAEVNKRDAGMCFACGQMYCGTCNHGGLAARSPNCPMCRAPLRVSEEENFKRCYRLVHDRSPGRHTLIAQFNLGVMYEKGQGVQQDYRQAERFYLLAADHGSIRGQNSLGYLYSNGDSVGKGVAQDYTKAAKYWRLAADQGVGIGISQAEFNAGKTNLNSMEAQYNLGCMYAGGTGVKKDMAEASRLYHFAAVQGSADAQANLGNLYAHGVTVPMSYRKATKLMQMALAQGKDAFMHNDTAEVAAEALDGYQHAHLIPRPPQGCTVSTILLRSRASSKYNGRSGVVARTADTKPGKVAVLLDGEVKALYFDLKNIHW